jgi:di/tricarboxylate transporter
VGYSVTSGYNFLFVLTLVQIVFIIGGGFALAAAFSDTGFTDYLAQNLTSLRSLSPYPCTLFLSKLFISFNFVQEKFIMNLFS